MSLIRMYETNIYGIFYKLISLNAAAKRVRIIELINQLTGNSQAN